MLVLKIFFSYFKSIIADIYDYNGVNIQVEPKEQKYENNEASRKEIRKLHVIIVNNYASKLLEK